MIDKSSQLSQHSLRCKVRGFKPPKGLGHGKNGPSAQLPICVKHDALVKKSRSIGFPKTHPESQTRHLTSNHSIPSPQILTKRPKKQNDPPDKKKKKKRNKPAALETPCTGGTAHRHLAPARRSASCAQLYSLLSRRARAAAGSESVGQRRPRG